MKKIIILLLVLSFQQNSIHSQNWDWSQRLNMFSQLQGVYPTPYDSWILFGQTPTVVTNNSIIELRQFYMALVDTSGTVWGEVSVDGPVFDRVHIMNDSTLLFGFETNLINSLYDTIRFEYLKIREDELVWEESTLASNTNWEIISSINDELIEYKQISMDSIAEVGIVKITEIVNPTVIHEIYFHQSFIKDFISLENNQHLAVGEIQHGNTFYGIMKLGTNLSNEIDTLHIGLENIEIKNIFLLPDENILAVSNQAVYKLSPEFDLIDEQNFSFLEDLIDITFNGNDILVLNKKENEKSKVYQISDSLHLTTYEFGNTHTHPKNIEVDGNQVGVGANISINPSVNRLRGPSLYDPSSFYLKVFEIDQTLEEESVNIALTDVDYDEFSFGAYIDTYDCGYDMVSGSFKNMKFEVKNVGEKTINEFFINYHRYPELYCFSNNYHYYNYHFTKKVFNLNLQPGESETIQVSSMPSFPISGSREYCFWISTIDHTVDSDFSNNIFCKEFIIPAEEIPNEVPQDDRPSQITPNPFHESLQMFMNRDEHEGEVTIQVFNVLGQIIYEQTIDPVNMPLNWIDTNRWDIGTYFIRWGSGGNLTIQKFIKY